MSAFLYTSNLYDTKEYSLLDLWYNKALLEVVLFNTVLFCFEFKNISMKTLKH